MLQTAPSFSIYNTASDEFEDDKNRQQDSDEGVLKRTITIGDSIEAKRGDGDFSSGKNSMGLIEEGEEEEERLSVIKPLCPEKEQQPASPPFYLVTGLGLGADATGFGYHVSGDDLSMANIDARGNLEVYYKSMIDAFPFHPLFLRNYAEVLLSNGDLHGAEEYYFRATLEDPEDGEILMQYAKLVWQLHHDRDKALSYFERAAQATDHDSHVHAAYANFLWKIEDDQEEDEACQDQIQGDRGESMNELENTDSQEGTKKVSSSLNIAAGNGIEIPDKTAAAFGRDENVEENYKMMIEENPNNALFLKKYAQFLCQSKEDLQQAEEHYLRAILADPRDGEIMAQYAKLVWELHRDSEKALSYFERAVQTTPEDGHVLGAYAHFLWETEEEEDRVTQYSFRCLLYKAHDHCNCVNSPGTDCRYTEPGSNGGHRS